MQLHSLYSYMQLFVVRFYAVFAGWSSGGVIGNNELTYCLQMSLNYDKPNTIDVFNVVLNAHIFCEMALEYEKSHGLLMCECVPVRKVLYLK